MPVWVLVCDPEIVYCGDGTMDSMRMQLFELSAMKIAPAVSTAMSMGRLIDTAAASPLSPENPATPVPAIVVIIPPLGEIKRMRELFFSATYTFPAESVFTAKGPERKADDAAPPSPIKIEDPPPPAKVVMMLAEMRRMRPLPRSAMKTSPAAFIATPVGPTRRAFVGEPPSPIPDEGEPPPARVRIVPLALTTRIRLFA